MAAELHHFKENLSRFHSLARNPSSACSIALTQSLDVDCLLPAHRASLPLPSGQTRLIDGNRDRLSRTAVRLKTDNSLPIPFKAPAETLKHLCRLLVIERRSVRPSQRWVFCLLHWMIKNKSCSLVNDGKALVGRTTAVPRRRLPRRSTAKNVKRRYTKRTPTGLLDS